MILFVKNSHSSDLTMIPFGRLRLTNPRRLSNLTPPRETPIARRFNPHNNRDRERFETCKDSHKQANNAIKQQPIAQRSNCVSKMVSTPTTRDPRGRFAPGNGGGPGRPRKEREAVYQAAFSDALPPATFGAIVRMLATKALGGSVQAARLLIEHAIGRPSLKIEWSDDSEFRVAGLTPDGATANLIEQLRARLEQIHQREAALQEWQSNGSRATSPPEPRAATNGQANHVDAIEPSKECNKSTAGPSIEARILASHKAGLSIEQISSNHDVSPQQIKKIIRSGE